MQLCYCVFPPGSPHCWRLAFPTRQAAEAALRERRPGRESEYEIREATAAPNHRTSESGLIVDYVHT